MGQLPFPRKIIQACGHTNNGRQDAKRSPIEDAALEPRNFRMGLVGNQAIHQVENYANEEYRHTLPKDWKRLVHNMN
jgi:hypothetical protein